MIGPGTNPDIPVYAGVYWSCAGKDPHPWLFPWAIDPSYTHTQFLKPTTVGQVVRAESLKASLESGAGSSPGERRNLKGVAVGRKEKGDERGIPKRDWLSSFAMKSLKLLARGWPLVPRSDSLHDRYGH